MGVAPLEAMRPIAIVSMTMSVLLMGVIVRQCRGSWIAALFAALFVATLPAALNVYSMGWTEGLFLALLLASALCLWRFMSAPGGLRLVPLGFSGALVFLVKFPGAAWVVALVLVLLIWRPAGTRRRVFDALAVLVIASTPTLAWAARNAYVAGDAWGRNPSLHPLPLFKVRQALGTILSWFIPESALRAGWQVVRDQPLLTAVLTAIGLMAALGLAWLTVRRLRPLARTRPSHPSIEESVHAAPAMALGLFGVVYILMLGVSMLTLDAETPTDSRKLLLALIPAVPVLALTAERLWRRIGPSARPVLAIVLGLILASNIMQSVGWAHAAHAGGVGYTALAWQRSEVLRRASSLPADVKLYSNHPAAVYLNTGRFAAILPMAVNPATSRTRPEYQHEVTALQSDVIVGVAAIVVFDLAPTADYLISEADLRALLPPTLEHRVPGGTLYSAL
jgi:hypothetical protein